jgi:hypothetical protein
MKKNGNHPQNTHEYRGITRINQTAICGVNVLSGLLQSIPSRSIDSCARLRETVPLSAFGQMNRPRSKRLENKQRPSPSHHRSFTMSPLRPLNTKTCPENGCCSRTVCTFALRPSKPRRMSVTPAASQILVPDRSSITSAGSQGSNATAPDQRHPRH